MNTLTVGEVQAIYSAQMARKDAPRRFDPVKATRVLLKEALLARNPLPYTTVTDQVLLDSHVTKRAKGKAEWLAAWQKANPSKTEDDALDVFGEISETLHLRLGHPTRVERAELVAHLRSQVTEEDHTAYAKAKGTPDAVGVLDAHHFAQKMAGVALWKEVDRLIDLAKIGASR